MTATGSHVHFYSLRGAQPYTPGAFSRCEPVASTAPHPSALTGSHLPPGEGSQKYRAGSSESMAPPTRREAAPRRFLRMEFGVSGRAAAITGPIAGLS